MSKPTMDPRLDDFDWYEAFGYAGEPGTSAGVLEPIGTVGSKCSTKPFTRADVAEIIALSEGEADGASWLIVGKLRDGRYFFLSAGCDYTGWD